MILCEEKAQSQAKNESFFQFLGHNVPINSSELLGVKKEMKPFCTALLRGIIHVSMCTINEVTEKRNFDTNPDPDPEWPLICDMCSNTK